MSIFKRADIGAALAYYSFVVPLRCPLLYVYVLSYFVIAFFANWVLSTYLNFSFAFSWVRIVVQSILFSGANIFIIGMIRSANAYLLKKTVSLRDSLYYPWSMVRAMFWYLAISFVAEWFRYPGFSSLETFSVIAILYLCASVVELGWRIINFYFRPVIAFETQSFFVAIGESLSYFVQTWVEFIGAWFVSIVFFLCTLYLVGLIFGYEAIKLIVLIDRSGFVFAKELLSSTSFVAIILGLLNIFFVTSMFVLIPLFYVFVRQGKSLAFLKRTK